MLRILVLGAVFAMWAAPSTAKERAITPSPMVTALANCAKVRDNAARLACYDRAAPALVGAAASGDIRVVDRESVRKARRSLFGFALPSLPFFDSGDDKDAAPAKLESTIVSFRSIGNEFYRFSIADGGAVWETTEGATLRDAKSGEKVIITRGMMGSYFAKIANQREVRVRRIR
jgi:hypothetical protein